MNSDCDEISEPKSVFKGSWSLSPFRISYEATQSRINNGDAVLDVQPQGCAYFFVNGDYKL